FEMFIAMNRFQVKIGSEAAFETVWRSRESYLSNMAGFVEFHLLKGPVAEDHTLYSSHTVWVDKAAFEAWTKSEEFRRAHAGAGGEFGAALNDVAQWVEVSLIVHTADAIFELTGSMPAGEVGRGYFNLVRRKGLHDHRRHERCAAVAFVERPFMRKSSAFIA